MVSRDSFNVWIAVYMMATRKHGTIYTGVTSRLVGRTHQHREGLMEGFTKRYGVHRLVWYETHESMVAAIQREKSIKKYKREWKINLIERNNPDWNDLFPTLMGATDHARWPEVERIKPK
ncbi:MAG: GIY-YIG nuclease family protein [Brevundimonas sp.]|nr:GIY-YIG nuclease family protein [Brevundimonas sp.]